MRIQSLFVAFLLCIALPLQAFAMTQINSVRLWRAPDNTRLVFDLSGPVQHKVFTLSAPDRIVIDIEKTKLSTELNGLTGNKSPITQVRTGQREADELRIVLDLSEQVSPKSFTLTPNQKYGHRLVVDLFDKTSSKNQPPQKAATNSIATPKLSSLPSSAKKDIMIAIDAGHGGEDPGAIRPGGIREKDVVLRIAKELQQQINAEKASVLSWCAPVITLSRYAAAQILPAKKALICLFPFMPMPHYAAPLLALLYASIR